MPNIDVDAEIYSVRYKVQTVKPDTTGAGYSHLFVKANGLYLVDENDVETPIAVDIGARVYNDSDIVTSYDVVTTLTFNQEYWDTDNIHDTGIEPGRLTCRTAGKYLVVGQVDWEAHASDDRQLFIFLNGTTGLAAIYQDAVSRSLVYSRMQIVTFCDLEVDDYLEFKVRQTSGGNLDVLSSSEMSPIFSMQRMG